MNIKLLLTTLCILLCNCTPQPIKKAVIPYQPPQPQNLTTNINTILKNPILAKTTVGIHIVRLKDRQVIFSQNAEKLMHPASTMKLFTTALALEHLGSNYQFPTTLSTDGTIRPHLRNLYLIGGGDPALTIKHLEGLAQQLHNRGIRTIDTLFYDDSFLDDTKYGNGWMWDDQPFKDFAPISALSLNRNIVEITVSPGKKQHDPVHITTQPTTAFISIINKATTSNHAANRLKITRDMDKNQNRVVIEGTLNKYSKEYITRRNIKNPSLYTATLFIELCKARGIIVHKPPKPSLAPDKTTVITTHKSAPLADLLTDMNKESVNIYAELLLKTTAAHLDKEAGNARKGLHHLKNLLKSWHIDSHHLSFADGSGVSRYNLVTAKSITSLLTHVYTQSNYKKIFAKSLPIGGFDGDLDWRMEKLEQQHNVHAKTGYLRGVSTLAGFIETASGDNLAFTIMIQHFTGSARPILKVQDEICVLLSQL